MEKKTSVLSIYRSPLLENRGTPLRVKSLIKQSVKDDSFAWHTCTLDNVSPLDLPHLHITHNKVDDIKNIARYVKKNDIHVLIFHSIAAAFYLPFLKVVLPNKKFVLEMHGFREEESYLYGSISTVRYRFEKFAYGFIYRMSDLITTCSISATEYLMKYNSNVVSVYGGFDASLFDPATPSGGYIHRKEGDIVVGYAGDGRKWQGLPFLLDSFDILAGKYPEFRLELLLSEKRKIPDRPYIHVTDALPHEKVSSFTVDCDILVLPRIKSRVNELTYPSKFMEYMAMGKPVVASRTSDMHKIIKHGENGMLFEPEDTEGFISAMAILRDSEVRTRIGRNARKTAVEGYTWDVQGKVFTDAIKDLVK